MLTNYKKQTKERKQKFCCHSFDLGMELFKLGVVIGLPGNFPLQQKGCFCTAIFKFYFKKQPSLLLPVTPLYLNDIGIIIDNWPLSSADGSALRRCCDVDDGGPMSCRSFDLRSRSTDDLSWNKFILPLSLSQRTLERK